MILRGGGSAHLKTLAVICIFLFAHGGIARTDTTTSSCWDGPAPEGVDPCKLIDKGKSLVSAMGFKAERLVRELAEGLDVRRSLRVQEGLVREHLQWQYEDLSKRQVDALVYAAVAKRLEATGEELTSLRRELESEDNADKRRRLKGIELFRSQALTLLVRLSDELEETAPGTN
jgi:hypothetical protein